MRIIETFWDHLGIERKLNSSPSHGRLNLPSWREYVQSKPTEGVQWELNRRPLFSYRRWARDQGTQGLSAPHAFVGALQTARALAGHPHTPLSSECVAVQTYGPCTVFSETVSLLLNTGTIPEPEKKIDYPNELPADWMTTALKYRFTKLLICESFDDLLTSMSLGWIPVFNFRVGPCFEKFDSYGVAGHDYGLTNQAAYADGIKRLDDGRWVLDTVLSLSFDWGPFQNGRCYLDGDHLFGGDPPHDVCVGYVEDYQNLIPMAG